MIEWKLPMAAFENKSGPDLDVFVGKSWSDWKNAVESQNADAIAQANHTKPNKEVARLKRRDFRLFGYCPAKDEFYVVVCEVCHLPVKPQAFSYHIEKHHKDKPSKTTSSVTPRTPLFSTLSALSCESPTSNKDPGFGSLANNLLRKPDDSKEGHGKLLPKTIKTQSAKKRVSSQNDLNQVLKSVVKIKHPKLDQDDLKPSFKMTLNASNKSSYEISQLPANDIKLHVSSSNKLDKKGSFRLSISKCSIQDSSLLPNGPVVVLDKSRVSFTPQQALNSPSTSTSSSTSTSRKQFPQHLNSDLSFVKSEEKNIAKPVLLSSRKKTTTTDGGLKTRKVLPLKARDYDPNKHCGVMTEPGNIHCTRSLTCKIHARSLKRKVTGRVKPFDELLTNHLQARAKEKAPTSSAPSILPPNHLAGTSSVIKESPDIFKRQTSIKLSTSNIKLSSLPNNKNKPFSPLFTRPSVCVVDRWPNSMQFEDRRKDPNQLFSPRHPAPLMVCHFGSRKISTGCQSFSRNANQQWRILSDLKEDRTHKRSFSSLLQSQNTSAHFTSIPPMNSSTLTAFRRKMTTRQRMSAPPSYVKPNLSSSLNIRRFLSRGNSHLQTATVGNDFVMRTMPTLQYNSEQARSNSSNSVYVSVPLDNRLPATMHSNLNRNQAGPTTLFPSNVRINSAPEYQLTSSVVTGNMSIQQRSSHHRNVYVNTKPLPNQVLIKQEFSNTNGISNDVMNANPQVLQRPLAEARLQGSYIFADDTAALSKVDMDQIKLSTDHFTRISQNSNNSNNMNSTNQNAPFQTIASGQSHQDHVINAPKNRVNYHSGTSRVVAGPAHRRPSTSTPLPRSVSDNWTSDILSLLEPKIENQSSTSAEDFSFPLRDNLINFSNDSANMTEISNT